MSTSLGKVIPNPYSPLIRILVLLGIKSAKNMDSRRRHHLASRMHLKRYKWSPDPRSFRN